jgi:hypothetical protein
VFQLADTLPVFVFFTDTHKDMVKLTESNAKELDLLFSAMLNWEGDRSLGLINVLVVAKDTKELSDKKAEYITDLLYIARQEQRNFSELFSGNTLINLSDSSVRDFLRQGGFSQLYKLRKAAKIKDDFRFWSIFIITVITLAITIYQVWPSDKEPPSKSQKGK